MIKLTTKSDVDVVLSYKPKPRLKVLEESFPVGEYLVKSVRAQGVRLTTKQLKSAKFVKSPKKANGRSATTKPSNNGSKKREKRK